MCTVVDLPGAVRPEETVDLPRRDPQVDPVDRQDVLELPDEPLDLDSLALPGHIEEPIGSTRAPGSALHLSAQGNITIMTTTTTPPRQLDSWVSFLRAHAAITRELSAQLQREHGLTLNDYEVLLHLSHAEDGRLRRVDLAERVVLTASGITRLLDGLERGGFVAKETCASDARVSYAKLTPRRRVEAERRRRHSPARHRRAVRRPLLGLGARDPGRAAGAAARDGRRLQVVGRAL